MELSWRKRLGKELKKDYFCRLKAFIKQEREVKNIYPAEKNVFAAFSNISFEGVKVVIVGQDPYHTKGAAVGRAFTIDSGQKIPPSLRNIYKEIKSDTGEEPGDLTVIEKQGVFLLNTILTVEEGLPLSHKNQGWEGFTDEVLRLLWNRPQKIVFLLWGNNAKRKIKDIFKGDKGHLVLTAGHPSPLSARYFFGCKHFTRANDFLKKEGRETIDWNKR